MKKILFCLLCLYACTDNCEINLTGTWIEQMPDDMKYIQGFNLKNNGVAESVGMKTLLYSKWEMKKDKLILTGESVGNGQSHMFTDTMSIIRYNSDTLFLRRRNKEVVFVRKTDCEKIENYKPSRKAYEGFVWKKLSGAGLSLWAQENDEIRLMADPSLPGIVMVRNGDLEPQMLIRIFSLPNKNINDVIEILEKTDNWDNNQTGKFKEVKSGREGVRRFVMIPDGKYASEIELLMKSEPVPAPCNGWGVGNSGSRYFEIYDSHPDKAIFVEIGQDAPLFDENSIMFIDSEDSCN